MRSAITGLMLGIAASILFSAGGCPLVPPPQGTGTLQVLVSDKPYPIDLIDRAEVTITEVWVHGTDIADDASATQATDPNEDDPNGEEPNDALTSKLVNVAQLDPNDPNDDNPNGAADASGEDGKWIQIFSGSKTFDLLDLRNGRTDLLADANLPAGTYNQMRLIVTGGFVEVSDASGTTRQFDLRVPSGEQTGIKLHFEFVVEADNTTQLLLDVDLSRTFSPVPGGRITNADEIREFKFLPSLGMRLIKLADTGNITGTVSDPDGAAIEEALVTAYADGEEVTSTGTDSDGTYALVGLPPGTYTVEFSAEGYQDKTVDATVTRGAVTTVDATLEPTAAGG